MFSRFSFALGIPLTLIGIFIAFVAASEIIHRDKAGRLEADPLPAAAMLAPLLQGEPDPAVLIGAGDISVCGLDGDDRTAYLIEQLLSIFPQAQLFTAGDNAQLIGEMYEYTDCFGPTWGKYIDRIHPSPGNHDWYTERGIAYFSYFGSRAGRYGRGYYSYDLGSWHIVSLNSNCDSTNCGRCTSSGCGQDTAQLEWLKKDLEDNPNQCTMLYWHHPLRTSGVVPVSNSAEPFWRAAAEAGADVIVNGHDHHYERFVPLDADGNPDPENGMRSFIVGTGGAWLFNLRDPLPVTEVMDNTSYGLMVFKLYPGRYEWQFVPAAGGAFTDSGSGVCH